MGKRAKAASRKAGDSVKKTEEDFRRAFGRIKHEKNKTAFGGKI